MMFSSECVTFNRTVSPALTLTLPTRGKYEGTQWSCQFSAPGLQARNGLSSKEDGYSRPHAVMVNPQQQAMQSINYLTVKGRRCTAVEYSGQHFFAWYLDASPKCKLEYLVLYTA